MNERFVAGIQKALLGLVPEGRISSLSEATNFRELGVDSIGMLRLITHLEEIFQTTFSDEELVPGNFRTVASLLALLDEKKVELESDDPSMSS